MKAFFKKIAGWMVVPLSYLFIGYIFIGIIFQPYVRPLISIYELFSIDSIPDFTDVSKDFTTTKEVIEEGYFDSSTIDKIKIGDTYGTIEIEAVDIVVPLLYGATPKCLYHGAGQRPQSGMPGFHRPTMIGGHTIPFFQNLGHIEAGDNITITTHYGKFTYEVTHTNVILANDTSAYDLTKNEEQLILFTCYPLDGIGEKEERLLVYADKVKGPEARERNDD